MFKRTESITSILQRFTICQNKRSGKQVVWFHAVSVGEVNLAIPLVKKILAERNDITCLVTTATQTSAKIFKSHGILGAVHQFLPLDFAFIIRNFLNYWNPKVAVFIESELWPNIINETTKNIPLLLLNGRLSDRSFKNWKLFEKSIARLLKKFSVIFPASQLDYNRFSHFTPDNLELIGHFKYSSPPLGYSKELVAVLKEKLKDNNVFLAVSTHNGEEEMLIKMHQKLKKQVPNLFTIIIPRHPNRIEKVKTIAQNYGMSFITDINNFQDDSEMLLIGAFGVLGNYFKAVEIAFIGGSLLKNLGGHNILEPAKLQTAIIVGPYTSNFKETVDEFQQHKAICIVNDIDELQKELFSLFQDSKYRNQLMLNAKALSKSNEDVSKKAIETIYSYIDG
ncbi:3-deoxy-D-manno-octulosonic acid transferase [Candidatus Bandiella euplotis]|uniref:3-deoxy-D-manno-octulosonic acid transferase n=1 Tax=Candidatus Bandiella euplotis TaxID=1664265 RepID=UPI002B2632BD|nr:3-deoxy-D-manno-octulosonic acid transferase [Candidatus Bandiella woodruffii]